MMEESFVINDVIWASEFQKHLDEYMMVVQESVDSEDDVETISGQPYCGCMDCYWREVLFFTAPRIMRAQLEKKIELL
jgi:hypothetical protein